MKPSIDTQRLRSRLAGKLTKSMGGDKLNPVLPALLMPKTDPQMKRCMPLQRDSATFSVRVRHVTGGGRSCRFGAWGRAPQTQFAGACGEACAGLS